MDKAVAEAWVKIASQDLGEGWEVILYPDWIIEFKYQGRSIGAKSWNEISIYGFTEGTGHSKFMEIVRGWLVDNERKLSLKSAQDRAKAPDFNQRYEIANLKVGYSLNDKTAFKHLNREEALVLLDGYLGGKKPLGWVMTRLLLENPHIREENCRNVLDLRNKDKLTWARVGILFPYHYEIYRAAKKRLVEELEMAEPELHKEKK